MSQRKWNEEQIIGILKQVETGRTDLPQLMIHWLPEISSQFPPFPSLIPTTE